MTKKKEKNTEPVKPFSDELSLTGMRKKQVSPLNAPVWRFTLLISAGSAVTWLIYVLFGFTHPVAVWIMALLAGASWVVAIRMLLLDTRLKKFWIIWLAFGFLFILIFSTTRGMWITAVSFSFIFLLFRRYKPFRHLTSRRRAGLFLLGLIVFSLLTFGWIAGRQEGPIQPEPENFPQAEDFLPVDSKSGGLAGFGQNLANYALWSLRLFWFFCLLHLFFAVRLHFMKLKLKLAVSALLITVVPLFLIIVMGIVTLYSTLGVSRAVRAATILKDWTDLAVLDKNFIYTISDRSFSYRTYDSKVQTKGEKPFWLQEFISSLNTKDSPYQEWSTSDRAKYFWIGSELWLMNLSRAKKPDVHIEACLVDNTMMNRLAKILHSNVRLSFSNPINLTVKSDESIRSIESDSQSSKDIFGKFLAENTDQQESAQSRASFWRRPLYFGMTDMDVISFDAGKFKVQKILLLVEVSLSSIASELVSEKNPLSQMVMIALLTLAILMLILEAFAFFFGIRITTGFTSAVKALHRGTRRIAKGDLKTKIVIPNEDELGDLAASFNEMAAAVKKGREEAIERERLEHELKTARTIQEKLLPHEMPLVPGFEIAGTSLPSQQVGGDYFDFLDMESGQLGIAIADVSGKGIPAALLMANLQASLHAQVVRPGKVAEVVFRMNNLLVRSTDTHMFATFFYAVLDRNKATFTSTNAGHNPPLLFRAGGKIERLEKGGLLLGFLANQKYVQQTKTIKPGDVVVLYTDGVTEAVGPSSEIISENLFGEERLIEVARANTSRSAREIQAAILKAVSNHTANITQYDDITLVVIKRRKLKKRKAS